MTLYSFRSPVLSCSNSISTNINHLDNLLQITTINSDCLVAHVSEIKFLIFSLNLHILAISETWVTDNTGDVIELDGYNLIGNDKSLIFLDSRRDTRGGGVAPYVCDSPGFNASFIVRSRIQASDDVEFSFVIIYTASKVSCNLGVVHRLPNGNNLGSLFEAS